jgi:alkylation response protein AidB-like acyl-CoA dehydrogenase
MGRWIFGVTITPEYGGSNGGFFKAALVAEECQGRNQHGCRCILRGGSRLGIPVESLRSDRAKQEILPDMVKERPFSV